MTYNNNEVVKQIDTITEADIVQVDREKIAKEFQTEEFQKANIIPKTVRIEGNKNGTEI